VALPPALTPSSWLFLDVLNELRTIVRMFFDSRYNIRWSTSLVAIVMLVAIFTSYLWLPFSGFTILGTVWDKLVDLVLAFFAYKALSREARRYRDTVAALPPASPYT
jgi:hypothetical protein